MLKRCFDVVFALLGLLLVWPILIAIAVAVKIGSPGPILYCGERTGRHHKPFKIFKFRTMVVNAEKLGGTTTGKNDKRVTRVGVVLRKYKLDELPQLINVLVGDMSFVGPRPEVPEYTDQYTEEERAILSARPGITDFASLEFQDLQQAVGQSNPDETFRKHVLPRKNLLRLKYVREQSFLLDMIILCRTVWRVLVKFVRRRA